LFGFTELTRRYFFVVTNYFLYGESIIYYFKHIVFVDAYFIPFATNHRFISFMLYIVGELRASCCCCTLLRPRFRRLRGQLEQAIPATAIRPVLLGPHNIAVDRCVQVR